MRSAIPPDLAMTNIMGGMCTQDLTNEMASNNTGGGELRDQLTHLNEECHSAEK
jgi:hypothetical protein